MTEDMVAANPLADLTAKQREVLDLLIEHKTSKEISRLLGISPHTVDQRIMLARAKLNVASRNEVAQEYRRLLLIGKYPDPSTYGQSIYQESYVAPPLTSAEAWFREDAAVALPVSRPLIRSGSFNAAGHGTNTPYYHVLPEMFDGPYGTLMRLGYIAVITVFLILIVLGGLSMFTQLSSIVDR